MRDIRSAKYFCLPVCMLAILAALTAQAGAQDISPRQRLEDVAAANSLVREGGKPWHLRISFEVHDLAGKPKESGTIEEWWMSPGVHRIVVTSPSYQLKEPAEEAVQKVWNREAYLVSTLRDEYVQPISGFGDFDKLKVTNKKLMIGKTELSCLTISKVDAPGYIPPQYCTEPGSSTLRAMFDSADYSVIRNRMAVFRGVPLALDLTLAYQGKTAITAHIEVLESYTVGAASAPPMTTVSKGLPNLPGVVTQGRIIDRPQPSYPESARAQHLSGTVVLCAFISKEGKIESLDVLASPSAILSGAAMEAVKKWTYTPYHLNGEVTEVETKVVVNFNLRGG